MSRLLREPLLQFLLLGAGLFLVYGWIGGPSGGEGERIVITQGRIEQLAAAFSNMHQRAPDSGELDELIDDSIREEIYYREAKALGLDQDDTIVRRRLRQKLEFVSEDVAPVPEPDDAQLLAYLQSHPENFYAARRYSFRHVYLSPEQRGQRLGDDARRLLGELERQGSKPDIAGLGDAFLLDHQFDDIAADELVRLFGTDFENRLRTAAVGKWQGPVPSTFGAHLILVGNRTDEHAQPLANVRDAVRAEWIRAQQQQANERFYSDLRRRYTVTIERPAEPARPIGVSGQVAGKRQ